MLLFAPVPSLPPTALATLHQARELLVAQGMSVLGVWALLNIVLSGYQVARLEPRLEAHHFHLMNAGWGLVNAVLAAVGIVGTHPGQTTGLTLSGLLTEQLHLENLLLFNAGLDVAYVATGAWLRARALAPAARRPERLAGFGRSLWVQGGFLFVFDVSLWLLLHRFSAGLLALVE
ncbi:DUF6992 family protein [uncultured Hymenobacter sp.]|uniref:DUF6992 family protein n=1 Tax=uncultured Hymenobacter sp. TaxID=170016 RepID=UPI0035CB87F9